VAERTHTHPRLIRRLNPQVEWPAAAAGLPVVVPNTMPPVVSNKAAKVRISLWARALRAYDVQGGLLAHFPCSIARRVDKRPVGTLRVVLIIRNPSYTFNPEVFPESAEGRRLKRKLLLPPGPNNPVGTAWIGLDRPGYGIHGTPRPEEVGRTESHGCFRLANWNAELLTDLVSVGTPVVVEP
jgi:lipoprotein-anchoring transpeptidase ErfK/SrfK